MLESLPILTSRLTGFGRTSCQHHPDGGHLQRAVPVFQPSLQPGARVWRNPGLVTDICYWLVVQALAPFMRMGLLMALAVFALAS